MSKRRKSRREERKDQLSQADSSFERAEEPTGKSAKRGYFRMALCLFFLSGFSALVYQLIWTRQLVLVFGATSFAAAAVLAVFMGGLALGSWVAGRCADRLPKPLAWYGALEAGVAVWALLVPLLLAAATPLYKWLWQELHLSTLGFALVQLAATGAILLVPTAFMGATLPLLARFVSDRLEYVGERVGLLYSMNTLGAICGAAGAGFFFLPTLGLLATTVLAAVVNFVLAAGALYLSSRAAGPSPREVATGRVKATEATWTPGSDSRDCPGDGKADSPAADSGSGGPSSNGQAGSRSVVLFCLIGFAVSGATAMAYEVIWTRNLVYVVGGSTYAYTIMVVSFLSGLFAGSLACAKLLRRIRVPQTAFAAMQVGVGLLTLVSMRVFNYLPYWILRYASLHKGDELGCFLVKIVLSAMILLPMALCFGAVFPLVVRICAQEVEQVGRSVGNAYAVNTFGAIAGAVAAGFVLLPALGSEGSLVTLAALNIMVAALLFLLAGEGVPFRKVRGIACLAIAVVLVALQPRYFDPRMLTHAQSQTRGFKVGFTFPFNTMEAWREEMHRFYRVLFWKEGITSSVAVLEQEGSKVRSFITSGEIDGSDSADMAVQVALAVYPLLARPAARDVAVIGWGTGVTTGTAALFPVGKVTTIELEPVAVEASKFFHHVNHKPELNSKVRLEFNDGRNFLLVTPQKFDAIISEPSNPWRSGVSNLFTQEYFNLCRQRLRAGGVLALWLQIAEVPTEDVRRVLAAAAASFPYQVVFLPNTGNTVVLASDRPFVFSPGEIDRALARPGIGELARKAKIESAAALMAQLEIAPSGVSLLCQGATPNSDDYNSLEFNVGKYYQSRIFVRDTIELFSQVIGKPWRLVDWRGFSEAEKRAFARQVAGCAGKNKQLRNAWLSAFEPAAK